jgi:hypothetical protein
MGLTEIGVVGVLIVFGFTESLKDQEGNDIKNENARTERK